MVILFRDIIVKLNERKRRRKKETKIDEKTEERFFPGKRTIDLKSEIDSLPFFNFPAFLIYLAF